MTPVRPETGHSTAWAAVLAMLVGGCGAFSSTEPVVVQVMFQGYSASASSTTAVLATSDGRRTAEWTGDPARTSDVLGDFTVRPGDSLYATAQVRDRSGALLAEARLTRLVQAGYDYAVLFQVGGINPDLRGFCHQSPERSALVGTLADTLYLWWAGLPRGAVC